MSRGWAAKRAEILEQARVVLDQAERLGLSSELAGDEAAEAEHLYPGPDWTKVGLGQQLVLAPQLLDKFRTAPAEKAALVRAVVDWERAGLTRPISKLELEQLWHIYSGQDRPSAAPSNRFKVTLEWATQTLEDSDSALIYAVDGGYDADDYVVAYREKREEVPAATWRWGALRRVAHFRVWVSLPRR